MNDELLYEISKQPSILINEVWRLDSFILFNKSKEETKSNNFIIYLRGEK